MVSPLSATLLADRSAQPWDSCVEPTVGAALGVGEGAGVTLGVTVTVGDGVLSRGAATLILPFPPVPSRISGITAKASTMKSGRREFTCITRDEATFRNTVTLLSLQLLCRSEQRGQASMAAPMA